MFDIVSCTSHVSRQTSIVGWYNGSKDSQKPVVSHYFKSYDHFLGKYTLDALHLSDELLAWIAKKGGIYLIQVKAIQKLLLEDFYEHALNRLRSLLYIQKKRYKTFRFYSVFE